jgi:hypothetical protein
MTARWISVYDYLADLASEGTQSITYGTLAVTLRHFQGEPVRRDHLAGMLALVSQRCAVKGEPDLTAYVVSKHTGLPSKGYAGGDPEVERKNAHELHRVRVWGK